MKTAEINFKSGQYIHAVFMCHLSVEKALKAVYAKTVGSEPPKLHNLIYFVRHCNLALPNDLLDFVYTLNGVSVPTRYPDELRGLLKAFDKEKTREIVLKSKEVLKWVKEKLWQ